jgi:electron transfer flavoprotein beta subunit
VKILVTVKRVPDPETVIKIGPDGTGITTDNVKWVINPFDEIAIEEALRIKEKVSGTEVVLVSIGQKTAQEQLRTGLAMGADRAILVLSSRRSSRSRRAYRESSRPRSGPRRPRQAGDRHA